MTATNSPYGHDQWMSTPTPHAAGHAPRIPVQQTYGPAGMPFNAPLPVTRPRPGTVLAGVIMTYIGSGLIMVGGLVMILVGAIGGASGGFRDTSTVWGLVGGGLFVLLLGGGLLTLAIVTARGSNGTRIALTVLGGLSVLGSLLSLVRGDYSALVGIAWVGTAVTLLWVGDANAWFRSRA